MKQILVAGFCGILFALGLGLSGMTNPKNILAFLTLGPVWNPSLLMVMFCAVVTFGVSYFFIRKLKQPLLDHQWHVPPQAPISRALVAGSLLFGIGWGLAGYCPGPAIVSSVTLQMSTLTFVASMLVGMFGFKLFNK